MTTARGGIFVKAGQKRHAEQFDREQGTFSMGLLCMPLLTSFDKGTRFLAAVPLELPSEASINDQELHYNK